MEKSKHSPRILDAIALLLIGVSWLLLGKYMFMEDLHPNGDNYFYLHLMQNMWEGNGYGTSTSGEFKPSNWFPPGYPTLLLIERWLFGNNIVWFKWINMGFFLGTIIVVWQWVKEALKSRAVAFVVACLLLMNAGLWHFGSQIMSEMSFMFFTVFALWSFTKIQQLEAFWKSPWFYSMVIALGISYLIRGIGVAAFAAIVTHVVFQKQWKLALAILIGFALLISPWSIRNNSLGLEGRYVETIFKKDNWNPGEGKLASWEDWSKKITTNAYDTMFKGTLSVLVPGEYPLDRENWVWAYGGLMLLLVLFGLFVLGPLGRVMLLFWAFTGVILLLWHSGNQSRYVWPLAPILYIGAITGAWTISSWLLKKINVVPVTGFAFVFLFAGFGMWPKMDTIRQKALKPYNKGFISYLSLADKVKDMQMDDPMVVCRKPMIFSYHSNVRTVSFPFTADSIRMLEHLVSNDPDFIVLDNMGYNSAHKYLTPLLNSNRDIYGVVASMDPNVYLLSWKPDIAERRLEEWRQGLQKDSAD
ncbi:MAG: hypothetical protein CMP95_06460 [Gammaproteobacteria bacterium]|nr:hypothetical protein [Gammaproteobacteria bacterium]